MSILKSIFNFRNKNQESDIRLPSPVPTSPSSDIRHLTSKVRQIEIRTKGLSNHIFSGEYHSAFKGRGMSFSEVREYAFGDDVRSIDWNVTARLNAPHIKVFEEERELTLMLLVDISASSLFGTNKQSKRDMITEICAVLSFSAMTNNDKVGVLFFSDKIERYIPPKKGKSHILFIIRELLSMEPHQNAQTDINIALKYLNNIMKKRAITFLLSDFYSESYKDGLNIAGKRHDLIGIHIYDKRDKELPDVGLINVEDYETKQQQWIDTSNINVRADYEKQFLAHEKTTKDIFKKSGSEFISIQTDEDYVKKLQVFFKSRM